MRGPPLLPARPVASAAVLHVLPGLPVPQSRRGQCPGDLKVKSQGPKNLGRGWVALGELGFIAQVSLSLQMPCCFPI